MFKKDKQESQSGSPEVPPDPPTGDLMAFLGKGVEFKGSITYEGTVRIDGRLEGEIHTGGALLVGEDAVISAKVTAGSIICKGKIMGDVVAKQKVRLLAPAIFQGSIRTPVFSIEEGVTFDGTCEMTAGEVHELPLEPGVRSVAPVSNIKRVTG